MKSEYSFSGNNTHLTIFSHAGLFYLKQEDKTIAKSNDKKILMAYIDGYSRGYEQGQIAEQKDFTSGKKIIHRGQVRLARLHPELVNKT